MTNQKIIPNPAGQLQRRTLSIANRYGVFILAVLVFAVASVAIPGLLSGNSLKALLVLSSILGIASIGQTIVILLGGLDLSVAAVIALSSVMLAVLVGDGWPVWLTLLLIAASATVIGIINGLASYYLRAPSLVVTLAMGSVVIGITMVIQQGAAGGVVPPWITDSVSIDSSTFGLPLPPVVLVWILLTVVVVVLQRRSRTLRRIFAAGTNTRAARLSLISVASLWAITFAVSGLCAALAGVFLAGFSGGANLDIGDPYLFLTLAAVVVGGTSLLGGRGGVGKTFAGSFLIINLTTLLLGIGINTNIQQALLGLLIVILVFIYGREEHVRKRI